VDAAEPVHLDADGRPRRSPEAQAPTGLRFDLQRDGKRSSLFYFQHDLRDGYFSENCALARFVRGLGACVSFCKCASYLLHEPNFSNINQLMLSVSSALVQDASSIPYRMLNHSGWRVALHGRDPTPLRVFEKYRQDELSQAFAEASAASPPLGFSVGYGGDQRNAGLIVAEPPGA
jgi:hypothetical protein